MKKRDYKELKRIFTKDKETLSDWIVMLENVDANNVEAIQTKHVRGFIQDVLKKQVDCAEELKDYIINRAGEELIKKYRTLGTDENLDHLAGIANHSPHVSSRLKDKPVTSEDTRNTVSPLAPSIKGCGKKKVFYSNIEHKWISCGEFLNSGKLVLCHACSGDGE